MFIVCWEPFLPHSKVIQVLSRSLAVPMAPPELQVLKSLAGRTALMERAWDTPPPSPPFISPGQLEVHNCSLQEDPQEDGVTQMSVTGAR